MCYIPTKYLDRMTAANVFDRIKDLLGEETMLDAIFNMLDSDTNSWILEQLNSDYDLEITEFNDED